MDSPCIKQTVCKVLKIFQYGKYLVAYALKDKSIISSIPTHFENKESPIICHKYNKSIRSTVFNYNKLAKELDIENSIPDS